MCGIVGYVGEREAWPLLINSLRRVTYRGYDSFGVAVMNGHGIEVFKRVGPVDACEGATAMKGRIGIGHTRWATVGGVSERNAHPHTDCTGDIAIVHNGDIDNYQKLKARLAAEGHQIQSDTDSELIAHLIEANRNGSLPEAVRKAASQLEGSYALAVIARNSRELVLARRESPIVVGIGEGETFVASDAPAILPYTDRVIYPEDGDIVVAGPEGVQIYHGGAAVQRPMKVMEWRADQAEKGGYEHYMLKEIAEQPRTIADTLAAYVDGIPDLPVERPGRVVLLGCGTSFHAALIGEAMIRSCAGVHATAEVASEFAAVDDAHGDGIREMVIAISQSGETADTLMPARALKAGGRRLLGISNVPQSGLARLSDSLMLTAAGPEMAVAATKTFTAQVAVLGLIAAKLTADESNRESLLAGLRRLPVDVEGAMAAADRLRTVAEWLARFDHLFIVAKGANYPIALEAALKFKEVAYIHAEGVPAGELKHGPFALLSPETPVLAIVANDQYRVRMMTAIREIKARGAPVVALTSADADQIREFASIVVELPDVHPLLSPVIYGVASQLLSYYCARARGCPIDRPRNLAKSVTVH